MGKGRRDKVAAKMAKARALRAPSRTEMPMSMGWFGGWILVKREEEGRDGRSRRSGLGGVAALA